MHNIENLRKEFAKKTLLSLFDVKKALGTSSRITAIRNCKKVGAVSSYSHKGSYYVLSKIPSYNKDGIWNFNNIWFSKNSTLLKTISYLVQQSRGGYFFHELDKLLHVKTSNSLTKLFVQKELCRSRVNSRYLYLWATKKEVQLKAREIDLSINSISGYEGNKMLEPLKLFLSVLNEKQRRLFLGFESMKYGTKGDYAISALTGIDRKTIGKGRRELESGNISIERIREVGGGREELKKKRF